MVLPALAAAGWGGRIRHEYQINDGKLLAGKRWHRREAPLRADYALEYAEDLVIAVVEAKRTRKDADEGIEQAKQYARRLDVPFAYATNGTTIYEIDATTGRIDQVDEYPSPDELWQRYRDRQGIDTDLQAELEKTPFDHQLRNTNNTPKRPRYYQRVAVNRAVRAIARGDKRLLLTLATGTGKTFVAYLIVAKLREVGWPSGRKPKILYLADRNVLVDQPKDDYFARVYGDLVHKISGGEVKLGRQIYFALYQSLENGDEQALFKQFPPDFFDLVIVDAQGECPGVVWLAEHPGALRARDPARSDGDPGPQGGRRHARILHQRNLRVLPQGRHRGRVPGALPGPQGPAQHRHDRVAA